MNCVYSVHGVIMNETEDWSLPHDVKKKIPEFKLSSSVVSF